MNQFFSNKKLIILLVSVIVCLGLIAFSITGNGKTPVVQKFTNDITAITGRVLAKPTNAVVNFIEAVDDLKNTYKENQLLKSKIDRLYETEVELSDLKQDNQKMKEQLELQDTLSNYQKINGTVISRNPDNWIDQVVVDRGSQSGITIGLSVMADNGLIGRVIEVSPTSSKVQLITTLDQNNNRVAASVSSEEGFVHGVINGYDAETNRLIMKQITTDVTLKTGDQVMTSGLGGVSPSSLLIGTVDEVKLDAHGLSQEAYVTPASDLNDIRYVTFIQRTAESGE
ncbi:MAG: rod shape-determining protein MreC [Carnobacterium sp.]|uniref:Cell shape-determining protein MreC n=1 Tax=Carnobacterium antarcticum TaxID=2126436 RepID=A0ABW4NNB0_9LACT|nr:MULTISPECIES: rod shape-determining protein MreC [unclassified Carnobacterium]ALV20835.1 Rod shape-determining protein MreC [Carnobacterium sp. CP1]QQP70995.1 rod shape-determining protein MreC [Carnobacterium sp. CS13]